jgi:putative transposase
MKAVEELIPVVGVAPACEALGLPRAAFYRHQTLPGAAETPPRPRSPRALEASERQHVLDTLHAPRFVNRAPREVYAALLDQGIYLCSVRTMYRILADADEVRERRDQLRHPAYTKPELLATAPNQVWSWDITKLRGPHQGTSYCLYVILDIFSRYAVGWMVASCESAELARRLIRESLPKQEVDPASLTLHSDRGPAMKSHSVAQLLATLGITKSHSRPHVSDDNPFSESQFKTLKYHPSFPDRFGSLEDARAFCTSFFRWYNEEHYHSGIALLTPAIVHYGQAAAILAARQATLDAAYAAHPDRFAHRRPSPPTLPTAVWINPPQPTPTQGACTTASASTVPAAPEAELQSPTYTNFDRQVSQTY